ncbi:hypothetical protein HZH68_013840 [Vespula germanica]|uniref:Uncharacterized protein n=1 Tax=Vespula germanica TaxID=30212 RepID=A0A834MU85_VESGE|nr:hypothetical protein HZH68_013840 [Vespula germanica]
MFPRSIGQPQNNFVPTKVSGSLQLAFKITSKGFERSSKGNEKFNDPQPIEEIIEEKIERKEENIVYRVPPRASCSLPFGIASINTTTRTTTRARTMLFEENRTEKGEKEKGEKGEEEEEEEGEEEEEEEEEGSSQASNSSMRSPVRTRHRLVETAGSALTRALGQMDSGRSR